MLWSTTFVQGLWPKYEQNRPKIGLQDGHRGTCHVLDELPLREGVAAMRQTVFARDATCPCAWRPCRTAPPPNRRVSLPSIHHAKRPRTLSHSSPHLRSLSPRQRRANGQPEHVRHGRRRLKLPARDVPPPFPKPSAASPSPSHADPDAPFPSSSHRRGSMATGAMAAASPCARGQGATAHLPVRCGHLLVRTNPGVLRRPSRASSPVPAAAAASASPATAAMDTGARGHAAVGRPWTS
jgi:hypothetical protein